MTQGHNQYAPMAGLLALREQIARKLQRCYAVTVDPETVSADASLSANAASGFW